MKILMLHGYSATNAGDGLLVRESLDLLSHAFPGATFTVTALHPATFADIDAQVINARPTWRGFPKELHEVLRSIDDFDLVVGVGGGYLRAGHVMETIKAVGAHGLQLRAASRRTGPVVYLPQSIGPLRWSTLRPARRYLSAIDDLHLRDDISMGELRLANARRTPDLALLSHRWRDRVGSAVVPRPVLSVRALRGRLPSGLQALANVLRPFDGYVQSTGGGNDDIAAVAQIAPDAVLSRGDLLGDRIERRVVIAVRLHAALMALQSGHWVIHLAYERKGFGAFDDLGLSSHVHNVNSFDPVAIADQVQQLLHDAGARAHYDEVVRSSRMPLNESRDRLVKSLRSLVALDG